MRTQRALVSFVYVFLRLATLSSQQSDSASALGHAGRSQHHQWCGQAGRWSGGATWSSAGALIQARACQRSARELQATTPEPAGQPADPGLLSDSSALPCSRVARRSFCHSRTACPGRPHHRWPCCWRARASQPLSNQPGWWIPVPEGKRRPCNTNVNTMDSKELIEIFDQLFRIR